MISTIIDQAQLDDLSRRIEDLNQKIDPKTLETEANELQVSTVMPDFWQDETKAKEVTSRLSGIRDTLEKLEKLQNDLKSLQELVQLSQDAEDEGLEKDLLILKESISKHLDQLELLTYLSEKYDDSDAIFTIRAGQGGTEAMDWADMLSRMYARFFEKKGWTTEITDMSQGEEAGIKSITYIVHGRYAFGFLKHEKGTHRLVRQSPFNADKLRQTSFAGVEVTPVLPEESDVEIRDEDLEFEASRSSGAGGQNVNKVSTAVRIRHIPSGIVVECQTQRYQDANRKIAMQILKSKLWEIQENKRKEELSKIKGATTAASWGTQIRSYVLHPYKLVKDLRTEFESTDPDSILDGNLDGFIESELKYFAPSS